MNALLAWYFVAVWGAGYVATKIGLQYAPPFTFLTPALRLRAALPRAGRAPLAAALAAQRRAEWLHLAVAGLLMHAVQLGGSHYAQYLGMSAGVTALVISCQPLAHGGDRVALAARAASRPRQWAGVIDRPRRRGARRLAQDRHPRGHARQPRRHADRARRGDRRRRSTSAGSRRTPTSRRPRWCSSPPRWRCSRRSPSRVEGFTVRLVLGELLAAIAFLVIFASILGVSALQLPHAPRRGDARDRA